MYSGSVATRSWIILSRAGSRNKNLPTYKERERERESESERARERVIERERATGRTQHTRLV